jgi:O-acetyl-ADP-ribose deacetylase (regulator of RNase III)
MDADHRHPTRRLGPDRRVHLGAHLRIENSRAPGSDSPPFAWTITRDRRKHRPVRVRLVQGDITAQRVDAVVNAANTRMRGGGGVDGAIHRAGGSAILEDCIRRFPDGLPTGQAGWTTAGDLPARWVIHVVGPNWIAGQRDPRLLASCYVEALRVADELAARIIAFPAVSTGVYGWPLDDAARIALETVTRARTGVEQAVFVLFGTAAYTAFADARNQVEIES